jgi:hypothetical protein
MSPLPPAFLSVTSANSKIHAAAGASHARQDVQYHAAAIVKFLT